VAGLAAEARFELRAQRQKTKAGSDPGLFILPVVIVREGGRSSTPRLLDFIADVCDYWNARLRAHDGKSAIPAFLFVIAVPMGRANARPMTGSAKQSIVRDEDWIASSLRSLQ
jgi:hypothetical protein